MTIRQFQRPLALGQLYDQLSHYHLILNAKTFRVDGGAERKDAKEFEFQVCLVRVVNYFYGVLLRAEEHCLAYGHNIITEFLESKSIPVSADIERSVSTFLRAMMENLFPIRATNYGNSQIDADNPYDATLTSNPYV